MSLLGEFPTTVKSYTAELAKCDAIVSNSGVDVVDLTVFDQDAPTLAADAFIQNGNYSPPKYVALQEAYDFVTSMSRLNFVFTRSRADYYSDRKNELALDGSSLDYYDASIKKILQYAAKDD